MTDVSPAITAPTLWNYDLCAQYPGDVPAGWTVKLACAVQLPARRYLIVQIERTNGVLNFCEIDVNIRSKCIINHAVEWYRVNLRTLTTATRAGLLSDRD